MVNLKNILPNIPKDVLPIGFVLPFIVIIIVEYIVFYFLDYVENSFLEKIALLEDSIKAKENEVSALTAKSESFNVFSQFVNVIEILKQRKPIAVIIEKFNASMPSFINIENINIDNQNQIITFSGRVNNLIDYLRMLKYLKTGNEFFKLNSISHSQLSGEGPITFSATVKIQPQIYQ
jgi:hypothetical protein